MSAADIRTHRIATANKRLLDHVAKDVFDEPVDPDRLADYLASPGHLMIVAVANNVVVGHCAAVIHRHPDKPSELYIDEVGVTPKRQREGVATRLLNEMFEWGMEFGCEEAWVGTELTNMAARALYDALGPIESGPFALYVYQLSDD